MKIYHFALVVITLISLYSCDAEFPIGALQPNEVSLSSMARNAPQIQHHSGDIIEGEYIVMFKEDLPAFERIDAEASSQRLSLHRMRREQVSSIQAQRKAVIGAHLENTLAEYQIPAKAILGTYDAGRSKGGLLAIDPLAAEALSQDPRIAIVEANEIISLNLNPGSKDRLIPADDGPATQSITYNIKYVGGSVNSSNSSNWVYVIDSGIDMDHPDLNVSASHSKSFVPYENHPDDGFGHGTHVAGIIGAKDNDAGLVGVAAGVTLVSYKVLDENGYGTKDYLLKAISALYADCIPGDVVNISLGTDASKSINQAVMSAHNSLNISICVAAGNEATDTQNYSPAGIKNPGIYVVGAYNIQEQLTSFTNYGKSVQYLAPGEGIYSTYKDGMYAWLDGTSMAAPHIAGILIAGEGNYKVRSYITLPTGNQAAIVEQDN